MSIIIEKVVNALASKCNTFIHFPLDFQSLQLLKQGFYEIARFPQCIGAIDCSHFKIKNPGGERGGRYRCRKGYYSINVQVSIIDYVIGSEFYFLSKLVIFHSY